MKFHRRINKTLQPKDEVSEKSIPAADPATQPSTPQPDALPTAPPPRRRHWSWHATRFSIRLAISLALCLAAVLILIVFYPWSHPAIDRKVQAAWRSATGSILSYNKASIQLSRGLIEVEAPVLTDPANGKHLLTARRLTLRLSFLQFLFPSRAHEITSAELDGQIPLPLLLKEGKLTLEYPWDRLAELERVQRDLATAARPKRDSSEAVRSPVRHVALGPVDLEIAGEQEGQRRSLLRLEQASLDASFDESLIPNTLIVNGKLNRRETAESLRLSMSHSPETRSYLCKLDLDGFSTQRDFPWPFPADLSTSRTSLQCLARHGAEGDWSFEGTANLTQIGVLAAAPPSPRSFGNAAIQFAFDFNPATRRIDMSRLHLDNDMLQLAASGNVMAQYPFAYAIKIEPAEFAGLGLALLAGQTPLLRPLSNPLQARLAIRGSASGDLKTLRPRALEGTIQLSGVDWNSEILQSPLTGMKLDATLTSRSLTVGKLQANVGRVPVEMHGTVLGNLLEGEVRQIDFAWSTLGTMQGLVNIIDRHEPRAAASLPQLDGKFTGQGTVSLRDPLGGTWREALDRAQFDGKLMLEDGTIRHRWFPAPIQKLAGQIGFTRNQARIEHLSGELLGTRFELDGSVGGAPAFWVEPKAALHAHLSGELAALLPRLEKAFPSIKPSLAALSDPQGHYDLGLDLQGDPREPGAGVYSGKLRLEDARVTLMENLVNGPLHVEQADLEFTTGSLKVASLQGTLGKINFFADAQFNPSLAGTLNTKFEGSLAEVKARIPILLKRFEVDGDATASVSTTLEPLPAAERRSDWRALRPFVKEALQESSGGELIAKLASQVKLRHAGEVHGRDIEMTFLGMPTPLRHITGMLRLDENHLWSPEAMPLEGGLGGLGMTSTLEVVFPRPGQAAILRYDASGDFFPLGEWAQPWHVHRAQQNGEKPRFPIDYQINMDEKPFFIIEGHVHSDRFSFHRLQGEKFVGSMRLVAYPDQPDILSWDGVEGTVGGGHVLTSGRVFNNQMTNAIELKDVSLPDLAQAVSGKEKSQGLFSGLISANAQIHTGFHDFESSPTGQGELQIVKSRMVSNKIFHSLGGFLNFPLFDDVTFSKIHGPFKIDYPRYSTDEIILENPLMNLALDGSADQQGNIDFNLKIQFLRIVDSVPLVGDLLSVFNKLAGSLLRFHVQGTIEDPRVTPL